MGPSFIHSFRSSRFGIGPLILVLSLLVLCGGLFWVLHQRSFAEKLAGVPHDAEAAASEIGDRFDAAVDHLTMLSEDMKTGAMDRARFETLASAFARNHAEVESIAWIDTDNRFQWMAPAAVNNEVLGLRISERDEEAALVTAVQTHQATFSDPYASGGGTDLRKVSVFVPVFKQSQFLGAFRCRFTLEGILSHAIPPWLASRYEVDLVTRDGIVAAKFGRETKTDPSLMTTRSLGSTEGRLGLRLARYAEGIDWEVVAFGALIVGLAVGVALAVVELSRDNKRRSRIAAEMEAARDMAEIASQAKTEFLANVSHEIRTPIGAIIGYADLQARAAHASPELLESAAAIRRNGEHLLLLVNELLDLSKVEAGLLEVNRQTVGLAGIITEALATVRPLAVQKGLSLRSTVHTPVPPRLHTDAHRLRQILVNILGNAVKFTERGGVQLGISWRRTSGVAGQLVFTIDDSGIGISAAQRERLFKPFVQADSRVTRRYGGTGLGLALSKRLSVLLGGDVVLLESRPGDGATFEITIDPGPLDESDFVATLKDQASLPVLSNRSGMITQELAGVSVLLIEDGLDNQIILRELLESQGAAVSWVSDGREGIERLSTGSLPDLILMDIQMPGMDGYQATRAIRARGFTRPIVALTAHAMRGERERCLEAGCDDYLTKPVDVPLLVSTIARLSGAGAPLVSRLATDPRVAKVMAGFIGRLSGRMDDLRAAAACGDAKRVAQLAHSLKGTAGNYGFPELARAAATLEDAARSEEDKQVLPHYINGLGNLILRVQRGHAPPALEETLA